MYFLTVSWRVPLKGRRRYKRGTQAAMFTRSSGKDPLGPSKEQSPEPLCLKDVSMDPGMEAVGAWP